MKKLLTAFLVLAILGLGNNCLKINQGGHTFMAMNTAYASENIEQTKIQCCPLFSDHQEILSNSLLNLKTSKDEIPQSKTATTLQYHLAQRPLEKQKPTNFNSYTPLAPTLPGILVKKE